MLLALTALVGADRVTPNAGETDIAPFVADSVATLAVLIADPPERLRR